MEEHTIPQSLDAPPLALIFNASQLFSFIGFAVIGVVVDHPFIFGGIGILFGSWLNKYADKKPDGFLRHMSYYRGLPLMSGRCYPNGLEREFRP